MSAGRLFCRQIRMRYYDTAAARVGNTVIDNVGAYIQPIPKDNVFVK